MRCIRNACWRLSVVVLCEFLLLQSVMAQQGLRIVVIEGDKARNVVQQIAARPMVVRIEGPGGLVSGATVTFTAPASGPSGDFANDIRAFTTTTGPDGLAASGAFHPNNIQGSYPIQVRAEYEGMSASAALSQTNIGQRKGHGKLFAIVAIAAAAGAAIVVQQRRNSGDKAPTITFGGGAVGAPKP
jgi:hypothetical protein